MSRRLLAAALAAAFLVALPATASAASNTLVINEVDYDQPGTDAAEFLELKNVSGSAINLDRYTVELVNGSTGAVYNPVVDLPNVSIAAGEYYVVCANTATTADCDLDLTPDTNLIQNGDPDAIGAAAGLDTRRRCQLRREHGCSLHRGLGRRTQRHCSGRGGHLTLPGRHRHRSQQRRLRSQGDHARGRERLCSPAAAALRRLRRRQETRIHTIQGSEAASPVAGSQRTIEGVVVGDFQGPEHLNGFFVQEEDGDADTDPQTSEGVFVVRAGLHRRRCRATSSACRERSREFNGKTQLSSVTNLVVCPGEASVAATPVSLPVASMTEWEPHEGMLVSFAQPLTIGEYFNFDQFNEIVLTDGRQSQPTSVYEPGSPEATALAEANAARPDHAGRRPQHPELRSRAASGRRSVHPGEPLPRRRHADERHRRARLRVRPLSDPADAGSGPHEANPRPAEPDPVGGNVRVASFNVLNYFTTLAADGARGADDAGGVRRVSGRRSSPRSPSSTPTSSGLLEIENNDGGDRGPRERAERGERRRHLLVHRHRPRSARTRSRSPTSTSPRASRPSASTRCSTRPTTRASSTRCNRPALAQTWQSNDRGGVVHHRHQPPQVEGLRLRAATPTRATARATAT